MKIDLTNPNPSIDAADLAKAFHLDQTDLKSLMRDGVITSRFESGIDADAGTHRLTFWHGDVRVRFTCNAQGDVIKTSRTKGARRE